MYLQNKEGIKQSIQKPTIRHLPGWRISIMQGWEDILQHEEITVWTVYFALYYFASCCIALLVTQNASPSLHLTQ